MPAIVRLSITVLCVAGAILTTGCTQENLQRTDTINSYSGDSVARNAAIHTINPTPRLARYRHIHHDGARMTNAIDNYQNPPKPQTSQSTVAPKISNF